MNTEEIKRVDFGAVALRNIAIKTEKIKKKMKSLETIHLYYLTDEWKKLKIEMDVLLEILSD